MKIIPLKIEKDAKKMKQLLNQLTRQAWYFKLKINLAFRMIILWLLETGGRFFRRWWNESSVHRWRSGRAVFWNLHEVEKSRPWNPGRREEQGGWHLWLGCGFFRPDDGAFTGQWHAECGLDPRPVCTLGWHWSPLSEPCHPVGRTWF